MDQMGVVATTDKAAAVVGTFDKDDFSSSNSNDGDLGFDTNNPNSDTSPTTPLTAAETIARREARFVRYLRLGLLIVLLFASITASVSIYKALASREDAKFVESFLDYSNKLTVEFQSVADRWLGSIAAFSTTITSITTSTNATWPFVTIPAFEAQTRHTMELANINKLAFAPLVTQNERSDWEETFVPQNINQWVMESMRSNTEYDGTVSEANATSIGYSTKILAITYDETDGINFVVSTDDAGPYLPIWQLAPFIPESDEGSINVDLNTDITFDRNIIRILSQNKAALGRYTSDGYGEVGGSNNPSSALYYPVLKELPRNSTLGGALSTLIFWMPFFSNILPESAIGVIGVLENSCNQTFTFRVDGAKVTFVGENDLHDVLFDDLKQEVSFLSLLTDSFYTKDYLGLPIDDTGCTYTLKIFPSNDLRRKYVTNLPMVASIVILVLFLVTSSVFVLYDRLVERRQRSVQKEAESSGAIVSSLFPDAYRERLMAAQGNNQTTIGTNPNLFGIGGSGGIGSDVTMGKHDQPIADLHPDCTVFFADIAGFTHWSSTRQPVQVFCLLQAIFAAMDKVAKKYHVFKVETIGDCYMAVTGLPNPQPNHALLMSRFASDSLVRMRETINGLVDSLGADTADLTLRMGLHSGPVTAGILRGEKSRFQLFGDTVNTASRMESTGEKSRIQLSSTTADLLRQAGKGLWLQARDDLVDAKGKGKLQTYWLVYDRCQSQVSQESANPNDALIATPHEDNELFEI